MNFDDIVEVGFGVLLVAFVAMFVVLIGLWLFASHDVKPYLGTSKTGLAPEYSVCLERKWGEDKTLFITDDFEKAQTLYFKLINGK